MACLLLVGFDGCNATSVIKANQASRTVTRRENVDLSGGQLQAAYVPSALSIRQKSNEHFVQVIHSAKDRELSDLIRTCIPHR